MGNDVEYLVRKDWTLMSPGIANGIEYDASVIEDAYNNTIWDKNTCSLFIDHYPNQASTWVGEIKNPHIENGELKGDVYIYDLNLINKIKAGAKFGISPELEGVEENGKMKEFRFLNFSIVFEPAVKTTYLNVENKCKKVRTRYCNSQADAEVLVEQIVEPDPNYRYFVDSQGNLCRVKLGVNSVRSMTKPEENSGNNESNENNENNGNESNQEQKQELAANQLDKIVKLLEQVVKDNQEIKEELKKKKEKYPYPYPYPAPEEEDKKKKKKKKSEELQDESEEETSEEPKPEENPPAEEKQMLGETLPEDFLEALREINSEYTDFVKKYIEEHKGEGTPAELIKRAAKEWKKLKREEEKEKAQQELQENKQSVKDAEGPKKIEVTMEDLDKELADFLLQQEKPMSRLEA